MANQNSDLIKVTSLWKNQGKNGEFFSGNFSPNTRIIIFPNKYKRNDNDPDFNVFLTQKVDRRDQKENTNQGGG
jgi:uncharacterized protein (DUF736 family)